MQWTLVVKSYHDWNWKIRKQLGPRNKCCLFNTRSINHLSNNLSVSVAEQVISDTVKKNIAIWLLNFEGAFASGLITLKKVHKETTQCLPKDLEQYGVCQVEQYETYMSWRYSLKKTFVWYTSDRTKRLAGPSETQTGVYMRAVRSFSSGTCAY